MSTAQLQGAMKNFTDPGRRIIRLSKWEVFLFNPAPPRSGDTWINEWAPWRFPAGTWTDHCATATWDNAVHLTLLRKHARHPTLSDRFIYTIKKEKLGQQQLCWVILEDSITTWKWSQMAIHLAHNLSGPPTGFPITALITLSQTTTLKTPPGCAESEDTAEPRTAARSDNNWRKSGELRTTTAGRKRQITPWKSPSFM